VSLKNSRTFTTSIILKGTSYGAIIDLKKGSPALVNPLQAENSNDMEDSVK
jgi:hypothetical protein